MRVVVLLAAPLSFWAPHGRTPALKARLATRSRCSARPQPTGSVALRSSFVTARSHSQKGYGLANPAGNVGFAETTPISIASITKNFTKAAILRLEQDGRLSTSGRDREVRTGATAGQTRTSRYSNCSTCGEVSRSITSARTTRCRPIISACRGAKRSNGSPNAPLLFPPGTDRRYSNPGYTLLAMIVEAASGMPYERYVHTALLTPAGMTSSGFYGDGKWTLRIGLARDRPARCI